MMREEISSPVEELLSKRILFIDDNPADQRFMEKVLVAHGYEPVIASSGEEGIELAAASAPDLILVDIYMPGLDGLETVHRLRSLENCAQTPIIALTAFAEKYQRDTYLAAGFTDYQLKQAGIKPLLALVELYAG
jgi:CheY-like chemotaxis protein